MGINPETVVRLAAKAGRSEQADQHLSANVEMFNLRLRHEAQLAESERINARQLALAHMTLALAMDPMYRAGEALDFDAAAAQALACMDATVRVCEARGRAQAEAQPCGACGAPNQNSHRSECPVMRDLLAEAAKAAP